MEYALEDCTRQQDKFLTTGSSFHVKGHDNSTRFVQCMNTDEYRLRSMEEIDPADVRMSSKMWEKKRLLPMGKSMEHTSLYGADFFDDEKLKMQDP